MTIKGQMLSAAGDRPFGEPC